MPLPCLMNANDHDIQNVRTALSKDLETLRVQFRARFPTTCLVTGFEDEAGVLQLAQQTGLMREHSVYIGKRFPIWVSPSELQMEALTDKASLRLERNPGANGSWQNCGFPRLGP